MPPRGTLGLPDQALTACAIGFREGADCLAASLFAPAAGLGAEAAMLMLLGMALAFIVAQAAGEGAGLERRDDDLLVAAGPPGADRSCGGTDIGAVEVETDALA